jgi:hypothetical protein
MAKSKPVAPKTESTTKTDLVDAYNVMAEEPVMEFKSLKVAIESCQALVDEYSPEEFQVIPEDIKAKLVKSGIKIPAAPAKADPEAPKTKAEKAPKASKAEKVKKVKVFGSHCHERVYQAMVDQDNKPITKQALAEAAKTTTAVVANAFHDFRKGIHTPEGVGVQNIRCTKSEGNSFYSLVMPGDVVVEPTAKKEAKAAVKEALAA